MDTVNFEPTVPSKLTLAHKRQLFVFTDPDTYAIGSLRLLKPVQMLIHKI